MKNPILAILILFSTFAFGQGGSVEPPKIAVKIPKGETVIIKGVSIKFTEVLEDSRCPKNVTCVWAGRAIVKVEVTANGKTEVKTLTFGEVRSGEEKNTNLFSSADFAINGVMLKPYPTADSASNERNYVLLVCEGKNQ